MKKSSEFAVGNVPVILGLLLMLLSVLSSCTTKRTFIKYGVKHPDIAAQFCADEYPAKDSLIHGKTDTIIKTVQGKPIIVRCPEPKVNPKTGKAEAGHVECPGAETVYKTITKTDTIIRVDRAKVTAITHQLGKEHDGRIKAETERDAVKKDNRILKWVSSISAVAALFMVFIIIRKP